MHKLLLICSSFLILSSFAVVGQSINKKGHKNNNKFKQLKMELATPNSYHTASGAPGKNYYQQKADYKIDVILDDINQKLFGTETITYKNNSQENLEYLWLQLDQNIRQKDSKVSLMDSKRISAVEFPEEFTNNYLTPQFDGGFNIEYVLDESDKPMHFTINETMMRIDLDTPVKPNQTISFKIKWWYNINNHLKQRGRSGYEYFPKDNNYIYVIAQFFPRMCVYNNVEGWQNKQFMGRGEFALPFGDYDVSITAPADHVLDGTGVLLNREEVFTETQYQKWLEAEKNYESPVIIIDQLEAETKEKLSSLDAKTWKFKATNVRDFAFSSSRKFIYEAMAVDIDNHKVMAISMYPKEGNPLWGDFSTKVIASTLKTYSNYTFKYPYHKAISVHSKNQGMEYPMICWNYGRPDSEGNVSDRVKYGMISVIIHEIGHNFFPMIVNSDERQWTWMDEGINTFLQYLAEQDFQKKYLPNLESYPSRRGPAKKIIPYMSGDQNSISPIMTNSENVYQFGNNAYGKPAVALNILRNLIMGPDLFDFAFKTYAKRWMFKHPTPEDFFRTMEDASAVDLDWFWNAWFFSTDFVDIGIDNVRTVFITNEPSKEVLEYLEENDFNLEEVPPLVYLSDDPESVVSFNDTITQNQVYKSESLTQYIASLSEKEQKSLKPIYHLYEVTFNKPGGIPMPILVEFTYQDNTTSNVTYPAEIWRKNDHEVTKIILTEKKITQIVIDPKEETADVNLKNNYWPKRVLDDELEKFKKSLNK